ncbi:hypothetical protein PENSPDRAFT_753608 [Peniophora sp. CONT]|nr:hypothetical protein PENSPDRAFT_753608 [Peniophora sp. CONT]
MLLFRLFTKEGRGAYARSDARYHLPQTIMSAITDKTFATPNESFNDWLAAGSLQLSQLVASHGASTWHRDALTDALLDRVTSLRTLVAYHLVELNLNRVPLWGLPRELINEILSFAAADRPVQQWMKVGHVCSPLRAILLECHDLWGEAVCSWPKHRDELFNRSGLSAPLSLRVSDADGAEFAKKQLHRARTLWSNYDPFVKDFARLTEPRILPFLEDIELCSRFKVVAHDQRIPTISTPLLKRLVLQNVHWFSPSSMLTELRFQIFSGYTGPRYSPSQFTSSLRQCRQLRVLELHRCIPDSSKDLSHDEMVDLPCVSRLEITDVREYVLHLWTTLIVPHDAHVILCLVCEGPPYDDGELPHFFDDAALLRRHLRSPQATRLIVDNWHRHQGLRIRVTSIPTSDTKPDMIASKTHLPELLTVEYQRCFQHFRRPDIVAAHTDAVHRLCDGLDLHLTHLVWGEFDISGRADEDYWINVLRRFPTVESLEVGYISRPSCCSALGASFPEGGLGSISESVLLPQLRELTFAHADLRQGGMYQESEWKETDLVASLEARAVHGYPLRVLRLLFTRGNSRSLRKLLQDSFPNTRIVVS